jgi:D-alanyl-D-alanine carboxypeptidase
VTAKKWLIYNMEKDYIVKGYKYRLNHDVASLSKLLTFYTAYDIVKEFFLVTSTFEILVLPLDNKIGGSTLRLNSEEECLITLQDALHALLMVSANNIAMALANNLGSYLIKNAQKRYFSCFDLAH